VSKTCHAVDLAFAPNRAVRATEIVSLAAALALASILLLGARRSRRREKTARAAAGDDAPAARGGIAPPAADDSPARLPAAKAAPAAVVLSLALGFVFAARATPLFALALFVILWRGISTRVLVVAASLLLVVVIPVLTLAIPVTDRGGYDPDYAGERVAVHWVAAAAVAILVVVLARLLATARRRAGRSRA
jgi:hypothetical protein